MPRERTESNTSDGLSRRKVIVGGTAGWASVALAGCNALSPGDDTDTEAGSDTDTDTPEDTTDPTNYVVTDDILTGSEYVPAGTGGFASSCSSSRTFAPGMQPVFKVGVYDPETGEQVGSETLDEVASNIDGGPSVELAWSQAEDESADPEWSGPWVIPEDYEPGTVNYDVEVTNGEANFENIGIFSGSFEVIEYEDPRNYVITDDLYAGSSGQDSYSDNQFISSCAPSRQFAPGMMVGFDVGVYDGQSGDPVGPTDFEYDGVVAGIESATLTVEGRGVEQSLEWAGGENEDGEMVEDFWWNTTWFIPDDAEPGDVTYSIDVETDTSTTEVGVLENTFTIVEE